MKRRLIILLFGSYCLTNCAPEQRPANSSTRFFDLKTYFDRESARLQERNPDVEKTVAKNELTESKKLHIRNWANELALFAGSDINKPAWETEYEITDTGMKTQYTATNPELRTQKIVIEKNAAGELKHIFILNNLKNILYSSAEELNFYPDSLYSIRKKQDILIIGSNDYFVSGRIAPHLGK